MSAWIIITGPWPWLGGEWSGSTAVVLWWCCGCCCLQPPHPDNQVMYFLTSTAQAAADHSHASVLGLYQLSRAGPCCSWVGAELLSTTNNNTTITVLYLLRVYEEFCLNAVHADHGRVHKRPLSTAHRERLVCCVLDTAPPVPPPESCLRLSTVSAVSTPQDPDLMAALECRM